MVRTTSTRTVHPLIRVDHAPLRSNWSTETRASFEFKSIMDEGWEARDRYAVTCDCYIA